jgi:hypothetical protein
MGHVQIVSLSVVVWREAAVPFPLDYEAQSIRHDTVAAIKALQHRRSRSRGRSDAKMKCRDRSFYFRKASDSVMTSYTPSARKEDFVSPRERAIRLRKESVSGQRPPRRLITTQDSTLA